MTTTVEATLITPSASVDVQLTNQPTVTLDVSLGITPSIEVTTAPPAAVELSLAQSVISIEVSVATPGPKGESGNAAPSSPSLIYADGLLSSINYRSGQTKSFTYTNGVLARLDFTDSGVVTRKTFNYSSGVLTSITQVTL